MERDSLVTGTLRVPETLLDSLMKMHAPHARIEAMIRDTPAKRAGTADDIADAVIYFLKNDELRDGPTVSGGWRVEPAVGATDITSGYFLDRVIRME